MDTIDGQMAQRTMVFGLIIIFMGMELTLGLMVVSMLGSGRIINFMVEEFIHGKTAEAMKANT